jgi:hypothetical protein
MGRRIPSSLGSPHAVLGAAERADPRGHAIHALLAMLWAFLQSVTNAGEGIAWGVLLAFTILRAPRIWRCWCCAMRDSLWWTMVGWFSWTSLTSAWGPDLGALTPSAIPDRWLLTPLMLWPVMHRPWMLLGAMAAGGAVNASVALVLSWKGGGGEISEGVRALSAIGTAQWQFASAAVLCTAGIRWLPAAGRPAAIVAVVPCLLGVWILAVRTMLAAAVIGCAAVCVRPIPGSRGARWALLVAGVVTVPAVLLAISRSPAWVRMASTWSQAEGLRVRGSDDAALGVASGGRLTLIHAALDIGLEHPVLGGGAGWFAARLPQWALVQAAREPHEEAYFAYFQGGELLNAHSAILQAWVDGGLPSAALLGTLLVGLAWRLWTQSRASPIAAVALALYSIVLVNVPFGIPTTKAPGALIATCLAISWLGGASVPRARILQPKP